MKIAYIITFVLLALVACKSKTPEAAAPEPDDRTPVTITSPETGLLEEYLDLNATSTFQIKNLVKSNANGYLQTVNIRPGTFVQRGQVLFVVKTKEAANLGNVLTELDSSLHFSGLNSIRATTSGYVTQLNYQTGDYVQDGEQLASIADRSSFAFLLDLPFELRSYLTGNRKVQLQLPDASKLTGTISTSLPTVDLVAQTQSIIIRVDGQQNLPENLIATVHLLKTARRNAVSLPKTAILTDETQSEFWIMQMQDDTVAIKVPIKKGLETTDRVEILSPLLHANDRILLTGNYGLPDTARVVILKEQK